MSPLLEARAMSVGYGSGAVVRGIDLTASAGEVVTILGANGAGKTTTLLGLTGALPLLAGTVLLDGEPLSRSVAANARRGIGYLGDDRGIFRGLTVAENLRLGRGDRDLAVETFPALAPLMSRRAGLLSGGEQQMLGLGRIIAARPRVLLADELSLGLAPVVVSALLAAVRGLADEGSAVILVEQHVRLVLGLADTAIVLSRGEVAISAPAGELAADEHRLTQAYLDAPDPTPSGEGDPGDPPAASGIPSPNTPTERTRR